VRLIKKTSHLLKALSRYDVRACFEACKAYTKLCVAFDGKYFEGYNM
jgi:hypothetical protein